MKKIINQPQDVISEMVAGLAYAYGDLIEKGPDFEIIQRKSPKSGKVALVSGGGSGHEPAHAGFVGEGMCCQQLFVELFLLLQLLTRFLKQSKQLMKELVCS